jgi:hypothetical protein
VGTAPRFAKPQGAVPSMGSGGATGLPPLFAESLLVWAMKGDYPAGAFANPVAVPTPKPSFCPQKQRSKVKVGIFPDISRPIDFFILRYIFFNQFEFEISCTLIRKQLLFPTKWTRYKRYLNCGIWA